MPKSRIDTTEEKGFLRSFECHGVELTPSSGVQAIGDCPFCLKDMKFYISIQTGCGDCKSCGYKGNLYTFIRKLWDTIGIPDESVPLYKSLALDRGYLDHPSLTEWGVVYNTLTDTWLVPGFGPELDVVQLYRYICISGENKKRLLCTPNLSHGIHVWLEGNTSANTVYLCEGAWDGIALSEIMQDKKESISIMAVPGCNVFNKNWATLFSNKIVYLLYHNDHPRKNNDIPSLTGMKRTADILLSSSHPPKEVNYICWGGSKSLYDPRLPDGYDIRDHLKKSETIEGRRHLYSTLSQRIISVPTDWAVSKGVDSGEIEELEPLPCYDWKTLTTSWRKSGLKWIDGLDCTLSVMLAAIISTKVQGDQLWVKIISPPSAAKSVLCRALSVAKKYVIPISVIRGFHSGFKSRKGFDEDNGLIPIIKDRTFITKDADTIRTSPFRDKILGEARDIYDESANSFFLNKMGKNYDGIRTTWIICGTEESMTLFDRSDLGSRMLDCVIIHDMDPDTEDEIGWQVVQYKSQQVRHESNGRADSQDTPEMIEAKRLTGGYVEYLRENAVTLLKEVTDDDEALRFCQRVATFVSYLRTTITEPTKSILEKKAQKELSFRLIAQFARLAICLAAVMNRRTVDKEVLRRIRKVGLDTARGISLEVVEQLYLVHDRGLESGTLAIALGMSDEKVYALLKFLRKIKVVESFLPHTASRAGIRVRWKLAARLRSLYEAVVLHPSFVTQK